MSATAGEAASGAFKVNSLSGLDNADAGSGRLVWDWPRSLWNMGFLVSALILGPLFFTWGAFAVFLLLSGITLCVGHSVGFHRRLIHQTFDCPKWLERMMVYFGVLVGMGGPLWTVGLHDIRDWAQRQENCHWFLRHAKPPLIDGFYYLNFRLIFDRPPQFDAGPGISDDPFYIFLQRTWMLHQLPVALLLYWLGGWPWVVWGVIVRVAVCFTMHWYIAHVAHRTGHQDWFVEDAAVQGYNIGWLAIPTMGESWHCNHHAFPASARHGLYPGQIDPGYDFVRLLAWLGLAKNIQLPANLPPRSAITPLSDRALSIAAPGQAELSAQWQSKDGTPEPIEGNPEVAGERPSLGDVVAISSIAALLGGFLTAMALPLFLSSWSYFNDQPIQAIGALLFAGMLGAILALFTAWPAGIFFGGLTVRFFGWTSWHAAAAGAATALAIFAMGSWGDQITANTHLPVAAGMMAIGALVALAARHYVMNCVGRFDRERF